MALLYVDEHLGDVVESLREAGHDVLYSQDVGQGRTDAWHFRQALESKRVLLTLDKRDFLYFHRLWTTLTIMGMTDQEHAGILVAIESKGFTRAAWLQALQEKVSAPEELRGRMSRWHPEAGWHEDAWRPED